MGGLIAGLSSSIGLQITGIAFMVSYMVLLPLVYLLARLRIGFKWQPQVTKLFLGTLSISILVDIISSLYWWGAYLAIVCALIFAFYTIVRFANMSNISIPLFRFLARIKK